MKYKNISNHIKFFKKDGVWHDIQPGEIIDIDRREVADDELMPVIEVSDVPTKPEISKIVPDVKVSEIVSEKPKIQMLGKDDLKKMSKDELNDYAAKLGFEKEVNSSMGKIKMISEILRLSDA